MTAATTLYASTASTGTVAATPGVVLTWFPAPIDDRIACANPDQAAEILMPYLSGADRERCVAAMLDTKHRLLGVSLVSIGSVDHTFMAPRDLYRDALLANASALLVAHNHPSGDPKPSRDDELVTRRLQTVGGHIGIELVDHLVFGGTRWVSMARNNLI